MILAANLNNYVAMPVIAFVMIGHLYNGIRLIINNNWNMFFCELDKNDNYIIPYYVLQFVSLQLNIPYTPYMQVHTVLSLQNIIYGHQH